MSASNSVHFCVSIYKTGAGTLAKKTSRQNTKGTIEMKATLSGLMTIVLFGQSPIALAQTGTMPIPEVDAARIESTVNIVRASGGEPTQYIYHYSIANPASSRNSLYKFSLDISGPEHDTLHPTLRTVPKQGGKTTRPTREEVELFVSSFFGRIGNRVVSIGLECPLGWNGGLRKDGTAVCYSSNDAPEIGPGEFMAGFVIHARYPPILREIANSAFWTVVVDSLEKDGPNVDREAAYEVLEKLRQPQRTLGPGYLLPSDHRFYVLFERGLAEMISLGWIPNTTLANELTAIVSDSSKLIDADDGTAAKQRLSDVDLELENMTNVDILPEAVTYLTINVDSIDEFGRN